jgi:hypothetical protein
MEPLLTLAAASLAATLVRGDVHGLLGWQNLRNVTSTSGQISGNNWLNAILYGGAGAGWYWTDHLKTSIDIGGGTSGRQYAFTQTNSGSQSIYAQSRTRTHETNVAVTQQYQFLTNQWVHPYVGVGLDVARQTSRVEFQNVTLVDNVSHTSRTIALPPSETTRRTLVRPFVEAGFKSYFTRRLFWTGDVRLRYRNGIDEVRFRGGLGIDF